MKKLFATLALYATPALALAQVSGSTRNVDNLLGQVSNFLNAVVPIIVSLAIVYFLVYVFRYAVAGGDEEKEAAKKGMFWGIVAIFVMVSVWGLVNILRGTFNLDTQTPDLPKTFDQN